MVDGLVRRRAADAEYGTGLLDRQREPVSMGTARAGTAPVGRRAAIRAVLRERVGQRLGLASPPRRIDHDCELIGIGRLTRRVTDEGQAGREGAREFERVGRPVPRVRDGCFPGWGGLVCGVGHLARLTPRPTYGLGALVSSTVMPDDALLDRLRSVFDSRDVNAFTELLAPDVTWGAPGDPNPPCRNRRQVVQWYQHGFDGGVRASVRHLTWVGDRVLVGLAVTDGNAAAEPASEANRWQVLAIKDGLVSDIRGFEDRASADEFARRDPN